MDGKSVDKESEAQTADCNKGKDQKAAFFGQTNVQGRLGLLFPSNARCDRKSIARAFAVGTRICRGAQVEVFVPWLK